MSSIIFSICSSAIECQSLCATWDCLATRFLAESTSCQMTFSDDFALVDSIAPNAVEIRADTHRLAIGKPMRLFFTFIHDYSLFQDRKRRFLQ